MNIACNFGFHRWSGCKCLECGKTRDEGHDWSRDCDKCARCGVLRENAHHWEGCVCVNCAKERHEWRAGACAKCGKREKAKFIIAPHLGPGGLIVVAGGKSYPYTGDQAKTMLLGLARQFSEEGQPLSSRLYLPILGGEVEITLEDATVILNAGFKMAQSGIL